MTESVSRRSGANRGLAGIFAAVFVLSSLVMLAYGNGWLTGPGPDSTPPTYFATSEVAILDRPPTLTEARELLVALDKNFNAGELQGYLEHFNPLHTQNHRRLAERLAPILSSGELRRESEVIALRQVGNRAIALVSSQTWNPRDRVAWRSQDTEFLVSFRSDAETRALFSAEVDKQMLDLLAEHGQSGVFNCLACNYKIQSNDDWLLVPHNRLRAGCIESISFYSLYYDLCIDLSVHIDMEGTASAPAAMLADLTQELRATEPKAWLPPAYGAGKMSPPVGLDGSQVDVSHDDGQRSLLRLAVYGPIRYLLAVRGSEQTLQDRQAELQTVLASFEIIDPIFSPGYIPSPDRPTHLIGKLDDRVYVGDLVQFSGPEGWSASRTADWSQFHITYRCPDGTGYVKVRGMPPPKGLDAWTREAADLVVATSLQGASQLVVDDQGWQSGASRQMDDWPGIRSLEVKSAGDDQGLRSLIRLAMAPNILVLLEANGKAEDLSAGVDRIFASLKQR